MTQDNHSQDKLSELRSQAEAVLPRKGFDVPDVSALSTEEIQDLVHELHVHQIELELQNVDLRQSQIKLEELKDRYLDLYDFAPVGYMTVNDKGLILEANLTAVRLLGVERTSLIKMFFSRFVCQEFMNAYYLYLKQVFQSQSKQNCEIKLTRKDSSVFYAQLESIPVKDEGGHYTHCRTLLSDITERKLAEDALRESEERHRSLIEHLPQSIFIKDCNSVYLSCNANYATRLGITPEQIVGKDDFAFHSPELARAYRTDDEACIATGMVKDVEEPYQHAGQERWVHTIKVPYRNAEGEIIGVLGIFEDITDRKRTEDLLWETEEIFKNFMEHSPIYVFFKDENIRALRLSKNFETMLRKPVVELLGKSMDDLFPSKLAKSMVADDMRILKEGKQITVEEELNGRFYWTSKFPIFIEGKPRYLAGYTVDITERKQAEEAVRTKTHQLNERVKELNCLYAISKLVEKSDISMEQLLQEVIDIIPPSWQYPEITCANMVLQDREFKTENYKVPVSKQSADIIVHGEHIGLLEVGYLEKAPESDEGPFLEEERRLIDVISEKLGRIVERYQAEEALRISEEKFSKAFQVNPDAITITRLVDGMFVSVNEGFKHLSGYPEEEVIGKTSMELNILDNPEDRNRLIEVLKAEGKVDNFEAGFRIKNGDVRYGLMSASIIVLNGEPHILNVTKDITERKLTEEQLRESEEKYRLLAENMNDVIWQTTPDMVFTYVSPSIKEQRGYDANEVLGRQIWDFIAPNEILSWRKRVKQPFNLLLSRETAFETEPYELHVRKDGTTLWTETMATPVINHEGNLIAFQGVTRDITERKQLEEALRNTLGRYHTILSSLYAGVLVVGVDGRVEFANQAFCDLFHLEDLPENLRGLSSPAMIQKIKDVYAQPADTVSRIQAIVAHGDPVKGEEIAMRDGRVYTVDFVPIHIDGKPYGRLWHHQDITERKRAEEVLQIQNQKFLGVLNAIDALIYVTDMKTYEIVFINTYGQNIWGDIKGNICWQVIQENQAGPCEFCTNNQLIGPDGNPTEGVAWEFQNTVNKRWYYCRDRAIYWPDGRIVRMEIATDITERKTS